MIYPETNRPEDESVPVCGPDEGGSGKRWCVEGKVGDKLICELHICQGRFSVKVGTEASGFQQYSSPPGRSSQIFYVSASWNNWGFEQMETDAVDPDLHKHLFKLGRWGEEEFHIVVNRNPHLKIYP